MKKTKLLSLIVVFVLILVVVLAAVGCEKDKPTPETKYTVTYLAGDGATGTIEGAEYKEGEKFTLPAATGLSKDGYTFSKWNDGTADYEAGAEYTMPAKNVTFTAVWTENEPEPAPTYAVTYVVGEDVEGTIESAEYEAGEKFNLPSATGLSKEGYTFSKWSDGENEYEAGAEYTMPAHAVTFTAVWTLDEQPEPETYAVTYVVGDGVEGTIESAEYEAGVKFNLPLATGLSKEGYTFSKWSDGENEYEAGAEYTMPAHAVTFTAVWTLDEQPEPETYAVTYVVGDGVEGTIEGAEYEAGVKFNLPLATGLSKEGYTFSKWSDGENEYEAGAEYTMPAHAVTFTAVWTVDEEPVVTYTITAKPGDAQFAIGENLTLTVEAGEFNLSALEIDQWELGLGVLLKGWLVEGSELVYAPDDVITISDDIILVAQWIKVETFYAKGNLATLTLNVGEDTGLLTIYSTGAQYDVEYIVVDSVICLEIVGIKDYLAEGEYLTDDFTQLNLSIVIDGQEYLFGNVKPTTAYTLTFLPGEHAFGEPIEFSNIVGEFNMSRIVEYTWAWDVEDGYEMYAWSYWTDGEVGLEDTFDVYADYTFTAVYDELYTQETTDGSAKIYMSLRNVEGVYSAYLRGVSTYIEFAFRLDGDVITMKEKWGYEDVEFTGTFNEQDGLSIRFILNYVEYVFGTPAEDPIPSFKITTKAGDPAFATGEDKVYTVREGEFGLYNLSYDYWDILNGVNLVGWLLEGTDTIYYGYESINVTEDIVLIAQWELIVGAWSKGGTASLELNVGTGTGTLTIFNPWMNYDVTLDLVGTDIMLTIYVGDETIEAVGMYNPDDWFAPLSVAFIIDGVEYIFGNAEPTMTYTLTFLPGNYATGEAIVIENVAGDFYLGDVDITAWVVESGYVLNGWLYNGDSLVSASETMGIYTNYTFTANWVQGYTQMSTDGTSSILMMFEADEVGGYTAILYGMYGFELQLSFKLDGEKITMKEMWGDQEFVGTYTANGLTITLNFYGDTYEFIAESEEPTPEEPESLTTTFVDKDMGVGEGEIEYTTDAAINSYEERGLQFMQKNGNAVLTSKVAVKDIYTVELIVSTNSDKGMIVSVRIGGVELTSDGETSLLVGKGNNVSVLFVSDVALSGEVEVTLTPCDTAKSMYIKTIALSKEAIEIPEPTYYTVTFEPMNDEPAWEVKVLEGDVVAIPELTPVHPQGKNFRYWVDEDNNPYDFSTPVTGDLIIYGYYAWEVSFDVNGAEGTIESIWVRMWTPRSVELPDATGLTYVGKVFAGWTDGDATYQAGEYYPGYANHVLTAVWEDEVVVESYTATFITNFQGEGEAPEAITADANTAITLPENTFTAVAGYTNYAFVGWYVDGGSNTELYQPGETYVLTSNVTFRAKWEKQNYTLTLNPGVGAEGSAIVLTASGNYDLSYVDLSSWDMFYPLAGWTVDGTDTVIGAYEKVFVDHDMSLTAKYLEVIFYAETMNENGVIMMYEGGLATLINYYEGTEYTVYYDLEGDAITMYVYSANFDELASATGTFDGSVLTITLNVEGVVYEFGPAIVPEMPTATFEANGGSGDAPVVAFEETSNGYKLVLPECTFTAPEGYEFDAWEITNGSHVDVRKAGSTYYAFAGETLVIKALWKAVEVPPTPGAEGITFKGPATIKIGAGIFAKELVIDSIVLNMDAMEITYSLATGTTKTVEISYNNWPDYKPGDLGDDALYLDAMIENTAVILLVKADMSMMMICDSDDNLLEGSELYAEGGNVEPEPETYTITYKPGDAAGIYVLAGEDVTITVEAGEFYLWNLSVNDWEIALGVSLKGWLVEGTDTMYGPDDMIIVSGDMVFVAQWSKTESYFAKGFSATLDLYIGEDTGLFTISSTWMQYEVEFIIDGEDIMIVIYVGDEQIEAMGTIIAYEGWSELNLSVIIDGAEYLFGNAEPTMTYTLTFLPGDYASGEAIVFDGIVGDFDMSTVDISSWTVEAGYSLSGWAYGWDSYGVDGYISVYSDYTFTAVWEKVYVQMTIDESAYIVMSLVPIDGVYEATLFTIDGGYVAGLGFRLEDDVITMQDMWSFEPVEFTGTFNEVDGLTITLVINEVEYVFGPAPAPEMPTASFDENGGSGDAPVVAFEETSNGYKLVLPENTFTAPEGFEFDAWEITNGSHVDVRKAGSTYYAFAGETLVIKALWKAVEIIPEPEFEGVVFEGNATITIKPLFGTATTYVVTKIILNTDNMKIEYTLENGSKKEVSIQNVSYTPPQDLGSDALYFETKIENAAFYLLVKADMSMMMICDSDDEPIEGAVLYAEGNGEEPEPEPETTITFNGPVTVKLGQGSLAKDFTINQIVLDMVNMEITYTLEDGTTKTVKVSDNSKSTWKPEDLGTDALYLETQIENKACYLLVKADMSMMMVCDDDDNLLAGSELYAGEHGGDEPDPTPSSFTVTFDPNNGDDVTTVDVEAGATVSAIADPIHSAGKHFRYWMTDDGEIYDFETPVTANITLTAVYGWEVSFDVAGAEGTIESIWVTVWNARGIQLPDATGLVYAGHEFAGWALDGETYQPGDFYAPETYSGNYTFVAIWNEMGPKKNTIPECLELPDNTEIIVTGVVKSIDSPWDSFYGNMCVTIEDEDGNSLYVYRVYTLVGIGDTITVTGKMGTYNGARQVAQGSTATIDKVHECSEWTEADCTHAGKCVVCDKENPDMPALGHVDEDDNGYCDKCGKEMNPSESVLLATFTFGADGNPAHVDGKEVTTYKEENEGYTLELTGMSKVYSGAYDIEGTSCLKLGTASAVGKFSFTVGADVKKVVIRVSAYKANDAKFDINGTTYTVTKNAGTANAYTPVYTDIEIDVSEIKTIDLSTLSNGYRAMIDAIEFWS